MTKNYTSVSLPKKLLEYVDIAVESDNTTYRSRADFIIESIRIRLRELKIID